jgi:pimeloyl-ACP methyl ester carboxylesterase
MSEPPWNHRYIGVNDIEVHYVRHGEGFPIVLLHGWPEFWFTWHKNILPLAESFDVVAPDLRGFGETEKPGLPDPSSRLLEDLVEDLRGLADALGFEEFGIVSHDVGAYVAQGFARRYPVDFRGCSSSTVLIRGSGSAGLRRTTLTRSGISPSTSSPGPRPSSARTGRLARPIPATASTTGPMSPANSTRMWKPGSRTS